MGTHFKADAHTCSLYTWSRFLRRLRSDLARSLLKERVRREIKRLKNPASEDSVLQRQQGKETACKAAALNAAPSHSGSYKQTSPPPPSLSHFTGWYARVASFYRHTCLHHPSFHCNEAVGQLGRGRGGLDSCLPAHSGASSYAKKTGRVIVKLTR